MRLRPFIVVLGAAVAACTPVQPPPVFQSSIPYSEQDAAFARRPGQRTISGQAFLRQNSGVVVTCAGSQVVLVPNTSHNAERMLFLYQSVAEGYAPAILRRNAGGRDTRSVEDNRTTSCDAQGNFRFERVPPGNYFVVTTVSWNIPIGGGALAPQGGSLMRAVTVGSEDITGLILTSR